MDFAKINHCFTTVISQLAEQEIQNIAETNDVQENKGFDPQKYYLVTTWMRGGTVNTEWKKKWGKPTKENFDEYGVGEFPARVKSVKLVRGDGKVLFKVER